MRERKYSPLNFGVDSSLRPYLGALCSGILFGGLALCETLPFFLQLFLPFVWVPYFWGLEEVTKWWQGAFAGFCFGLSGYLTGAYWVIPALQSFKGFSFLGALLASTVFCSLFALPFLIWGAVGSAKKYRYWTLPLTWLVLEYSVPSLLPWTPACIFLLAPYPLQWAGVVGRYGLVLWLLYFSRGVLSTKKSWIGGYFIFWFGGFLLFQFWEETLEHEQKKRVPLRIVSVQAGVTRAERKSFEGLVDSLKRIHHLTEQAKLDSNVLVLWHEGSVDWHVPDAKCTYERTILFGAYLKKEIFGNEKIINSAVLQEGDRRQFYLKRRLTPIGERVPFSQIFSWLQKFEPQPNYWQGLEPALLHWNESILGCLICYEDLFVDLAVDSVRAGATVLVSITNDVWFDWPAVALHTRLARLRAVENRRFLVRCNNTGPSEIVSPLGTVTRLLAYQEVGTQEAKVLSLSQISWFCRLFCFLPACGFFLWGAFLFHFLLRKKSVIP